MHDHRFSDVVGFDRQAPSPRHLAAECPLTLPRTRAFGKDSESSVNAMMCPMCEPWDGL